MRPRGMTASATAVAVVAVVGTVLVAGCGGDDTRTIEFRTDDDIAALFTDAGVDGTFVAREVGTDQNIGHDGERAAEPRLPASTFKILNSLVILEAGVLSSVDETVEWDGIERRIEVWNRDHSLRTGIEVSAVWMYQQLAAEVGAERMAELVAEADYGNAETGPDVTEFWLRGDLRISPVEQLDILERLVLDELPFAPEHQAAVRDIIVRERGDGWTWSHKTGTALADSTLGWLVGTTSYDDRRWVFALNLDLGALDDAGGIRGQIDPRIRISLARDALEHLGALPTG